MSRARVILMGLLGVLAVSAFVAPSALANPGHYYLVEQKTLETSEAIEDQGQNAQLEASVMGLGIGIVCQEELSTGTVFNNAKEKQGESTFEIKYTNCYLFVNENGKKGYGINHFCKVREPIVASGKDKLTAHSLDEFENPGGFFTTIVIEKVEKETCVETGEFPVTGTQLCAIPHAEYEKILHHLICTPAGSHLVFGSGEITSSAQLFSEDQVRLKSLKVWAAT
jgi:hypothetical protein